MLRLSIVFAALFIIIINDGCTKDQNGIALLPGIWVKGSNAGDTLIFTKKNNRNVLQYNGSFNAALPAFLEAEYAYQNDKLSIKNWLASQEDYRIIQSFRWIKKGETFEVLGYQLFPIMSSTVTIFTYTKIN